MKTFILTMMCALAMIAQAKEYELASPDGKLKATVSIADGQLSYKVSHDGTAVLEPSHIAMTLRGGTVLGKGIKKVKISRNSGATNKTSALYRKSAVSEPWNKLTLGCGNYQVEFVAYNEAVAYRFVTTMRDSLTVESESNEWALPGDCRLWATPARDDVLGKSLDDQTAMSYENRYVHQRLSEQEANTLIQCPLLVELEGDKRLMITDCNTLDYPGMLLIPASGNTLKSYYAHYPVKEYHGGHLMRQLLVSEWGDFIAHTAGTRAFPWRTAIVTTNEAQLLDTDIPFCLADENQIGNTTWVKPGKVAWEWWSDWNVKGVDFEVGINTATYKYWIDFAAERGIEYVIMDEGWSVPIKSDLKRIIDDIDLSAIVNYGKQKGVGIILWAAHYPFARDIDGVVDYFADMGVKGFKIDFINRNDQKAYRFIEKAARACARRNMIIDFHGVFPPVGFTYTFPNVLNFEGVMGLECVKWSTIEQYDHVNHDCVLPFTRNVTGPMDYTQGAMNNTTRADYYPRNNNPMSQGTRCRQLAQYVIFIAPLAMLCDSPDQYRANSDCTDFIAQIPTVWDETRIISGKVGEWVIEARRKDNVWFVGGFTNWTERDVDIDLSWLAGKQMKLYSDGINAHRNAEDYKITETTVPATLKVHMAPGGGFAAIIR